MPKKVSQSKIKSNNSKEPDYDVIVIGTGMGGSAAGAICALHGLKTLILEKNPRPGGVCSYYEKKGFHMDTGTHLFLRGNDGPFGVLTKRLGMGTPIQFLQTKETCHLKGMDLDLTIPRSLLAVFYQFIIPRALWQIKIHPKHYPSIFRLLLDIVTMKPHEIENLDNVSLQDFIHRYTKDPKIHILLSFFMSLFFIVPPWDASAGESIYNLQNFSKKGDVGYPKGGCVAVPKTFLKGAEQHGAIIKLKGEVKKIEVSNGCVKGVVLKNNEKITTRTIISTTMLSDTVIKLTGAKFFPKPYISRIKEIKASWTAVQAKIAVKKKVVTAGSIVGGVPLKLKDGLDEDTIRNYINDLENGVISDMFPIYAPVPSNYDPNLAPEGCQVITAVGAAPTLDVELKDGHSAWIDAMMNALYEMIPDLKENIIFFDAWSVKTLANWIGKSTGPAYSTAMTPSQAGINRPPHETPVKGLYIAGDCGGSARGVGTELACQSGMDCADLVASHIANSLI